METKVHLLTRKEAANRMRIKEQTLALWASTGRYGLPFIKIGRKVFYRIEHIEQFLENNTQTTTM